MDIYSQLFVYLTGTAIVGLVTAVIFLWRQLTDLKLHLSENYVKQSTLNTIQQDTKEMKLLMYDIAAKVGVPISGRLI